MKQRAHLTEAAFGDIVPLGAPVCLHTRGIAGRRCAVWIESSRFCELADIRVFSSFHFSIFLTHTTAIRLLRCSVVPDTASGRFSGSNADGIHGKSNYHGPLMEGCTVLNTMDDCGNLYSRAASLIDVPDDRSLVLDALWDDAARPDGWGWQPERRSYRDGDLIAILDPLDGRHVFLAQVSACCEHSWRGHRLVRITLDRPLDPALRDSLRTRANLGKPGILPSDSHYLYVSADEAVEHFAVNLATKSDGFVIRDCHMGRNTVTAWKMKASNGLIVGNRFEAHGWCCISLLMQLKWQEAYAPRNILIRDNVFDNRFGISSGNGYPHGGSGAPFIRGITIEHNRFVHPVDGWDVQLNDIRRSTTRDNTSSLH